MVETKITLNQIKNELRLNKTIIYIVLALSLAKFVPKIINNSPLFIRKLFVNPFFRYFLMIITIYSSCNDIRAAITVATLFIIAGYVGNRLNYIEKFSDN